MHEGMKGKKIEMRTERVNEKFISGKIACTLTAIAAALFLCAFVTCSAFFISMELDHDCEGEDCPVCSVLLQCENSLHQMGNLACAAGTVAVFLFLVLATVHPAADLLRKNSLVHLRVRLNN